MLGKTILTLESIVRQLDPDFSIVDVAEPFGRQLLRSEQFMKRLDRLGNRLSFSIVLLSFSIIMVGLIISSLLQ